MLNIVKALEESTEEPLKTGTSVNRNSLET